MRKEEEKDHEGNGAGKREIAEITLKQSDDKKERDCLNQKPSYLKLTWCQFS